MRATKSNKPSNRWRPRRRSLLLVLSIVCIVCTIGLILALPWITRSNSLFIDQRIRAAALLPDAQREQMLSQLLRASGGDNRVGEELAGLYGDQHRYSAAAAIYSHLRSPQWLKAAELYAMQYDFEAAEAAAKQAAKTSPEGYTWIVRSLLNQDQPADACSQVIKAPSTQQADLSAACALAHQPSLSRADIYRLRDLGVPLLAAERLMSLEEKTTTDWLFLSDTAWRQQRYDRASRDLEEAFRQNPWDRQVLLSIKNICDNQMKNNQDIKSTCNSYATTAGNNLYQILQ